MVTFAVLCPAEKRAKGPTLLEVMIFLLLTPDVLWGGWLIASGWRGRPRRFANGLARSRRRSIADEIEEWLAAGGLP